MNKQKSGSSIDWLQMEGREGYSWSIATGCVGPNDSGPCPYCWARGIVRRFPARYPNGFAPIFYPDRLAEPGRVTRPANIFVASMGDLFSPQITNVQIEAVLDVAWGNLQHRFFFLTKRPERLAAFNPWPPNALVGASVDRFNRLGPTLDALSRVKARPRWISFEPLRENLGCPRLSGVEWIVIGAQTKPTIQPKREWVASLLCAADNKNIPVYMKGNLAFEPRFQQYPKLCEAQQHRLPGI